MSLSATSVAILLVLIDCSVGPFILEVLSQLNTGIKERGPVSIITIILISSLAKSASAPFSAEFCHALAKVLSPTKHDVLRMSRTGILFPGELHDLAEETLIQLEAEHSPL